MLPEGIIATAEYSDGNSKTIVYSDKSEINIPMVVIVNEHTASAAELFAASLKDLEKLILLAKQLTEKALCNQL